MSKMKLFNHQIRAIEFCQARLKDYRSVYLGLSPGLGKTGAALTLAKDYYRVAYICPPPLVINVKREMIAWDSRLVEVVPDTKIKLLSGFYDLLIVDEAHRFKNPATARFKALGQVEASSIVFMSGTPMPNNRPLDILATVHKYAKDIWPGKDYHDLLFRYCDPQLKHVTRIKRVWDFSGFSKEQEFYDKLRASWLLRIDKSAIVLPPKTESLVFIGELPRSLAALDKKAREAMESGNSGTTGPLPTYRREIGLEKAKQAIPWLEQLITDNAQSVLIFCHHREVISFLQTALSKFKPILITGGMTAKAKQESIDSFQAKKTKLGILSIEAASIGITLTAADRVIMLESSWLDGVNEQASDRAHRIGQKNSVLVQHVVLENSGDAVFLETTLKKRDLKIDNF